MTHLDDIDLQILELLTADGRESWKGIADRVGLSAPSVLERVRKLETSGLVRGYTALLDPDNVKWKHLLAKGIDVPTAWEKEEYDRRDGEWQEQRRELNNRIAELRRSGFESLLAGGIVMTGGSSKIEGLIDLAEEVFHMPVRLGAPTLVSGMSEVVNNPIHATGVGLLLFGHENGSASQRQSAQGGGLKDIWSKMRGWFQGNF